ncbi:MAG TPA: hypothetical protein VJY66_04725 [Acholeplasma sp.]|nr:hypothetical protein [Acholeplasma sp.]
MKQLKMTVMISLILSVITGIIILLFYGFSYLLWFSLGYLISYVNFRLIIKSAKNRNGFWLVVGNSTTRLILYGLVLFVGYRVEKDVLTLIIIALGILMVKIGMILSFILFQKEEKM